MGASISCAWKRTIKGDKLIGDSCQRIVEVCVLEIHVDVELSQF